MSAFFQTVCDCVQAVRSVNRELSLETRFKEDLGFESIDLVDLLFEVEQRTQTPMPMLQFHSFILSTNKMKSWDFTIAQVCEFIQLQKKQ